MKQFSYGEPDYAFGQAMLTLRTSIGLTQASLAELLGVSRKTVGRWEAGDTYPKASHLKTLLAFALGQQAFPAGREEEEIRAFWRAAHQKVLLDEQWLQRLLGTQRPRLALVASGPGEQTYGAEHVSAPPAGGEPRVDWGDALDVSTFYGRQWELNLLTRWVVQEGCRVVSVLGLGGIGKSALAVSLMHQVAAHFEVVIWRSLRDAPACEALLDECLQVLAPQLLREVPASLERRLGLLLEHLRHQRALLVLDNLETLLEEGAGTGRMRAGYEGYGQLLRRVGETAHQSCLLLTSREKASELVRLEGNRTPVRFAPDRVGERRKSAAVRGAGAGRQRTRPGAADRAVWGQPAGLEHRSADHRGALRGGDRPVPGTRRGDLWQCAGAAWRAIRPPLGG
jgi:transcriptional regulator with XRE-family HTH domain